MTQYPHKLKSGTNAAVAVGAAALGASEHCWSLTIIADPANTDSIFIGDADLQPIELAAGNAASMDIDDPAQVFARSGSGVQTANYLMEI